jgi:hypothetical protein
MQLNVLPWVSQCSEEEAEQMLRLMKIIIGGQHNRDVTPATGLEVSLAKKTRLCMFHPHNLYLDEHMQI